MALLPDAVIVSRRGRIAEVNPAAMRLLGATRPEEVVGRTPDEVVDAPSLLVVEEQLRRGHETGEVTPHEITIRGVDGVERRAEVHGVVQEERGGKAFLLVLRDVTRRRQAERDLRQAIQRYETLLELSPVAAFINRGNRIEQVNAALLRLLGARSEEEVVGRPPLDFFHPDDHADIRRRIRTALSGQPIPVAGVRVVRLDGAVREVEAVSSLVHDARGKSLQVVVRDVTESQLALRGLRESEQFLRSVIENLSDGVHVLDLGTGKYVFASPSLARLTGFPESELRGMTAQAALERMHPDDRGLALEHERAIAGGATALGSVEYRWKVASGEYRWFSDTRTVIRDGSGRPVALAGATRDITDRKRAEGALRRSEARFRALAWQAPLGVLEVDLEGVTRFVNPALERIAGRSSPELLGRRFRGFIHPEDVPGMPALEDWDLEHEPDRVYRYRVCRPDGTVRNVRAHGVLLRGSDGARYGAMAVLLDLDELQSASP